MTPKFKGIVRGLLFLYLFILCSGAYGQTDNTFFKKAYLQLGLGPSSHGGYGGQFSVQTVMKKNWTTTLSYYDRNMNPKNLPADYKQGYTIIIVIPIPDSYPETQLVSYGLTAGKYLELGRNVWFTPEAGVSLVKADQYTFTSQPVVSDGWFYTSSNYATTKEKKTGFGGQLRADLTWAFASFAGLGIDAYANVNSIQSVVGADIKLVVGWMNHKRKKH